MDADPPAPAPVAASAPVVATRPAPAVAEPADGFQTFRHVLLPQIASALLAGGMLAFALSFDEIIVTTFTAGPGITTLPIWIYQNLFRPNQAPIVNVVAAALVLISIAPIYIAQKLSNADERGGGLI